MWFSLWVASGILELPVSETCSAGFLELKIPSKPSQRSFTDALRPIRRSFVASVLCRSGHLPKRRLAEARSCPTGLGRRPQDGNSFACVFANFRVEVERQPAVETKNATFRTRARDTPAAIQPHQHPPIKHAIQQTHFNEQVKGSCHEKAAPRVAFSFS